MNFIRLVKKVGFILYLWLFAMITKTYGNENTESRMERQIVNSPPLVYPFGGTFKLILGFAVPVHISDKLLVYGQNFQFQYALPQNATFFTNLFKDPTASLRRRKRTASVEKLTVYKLLEQELDRKNADGRSCLKRSICEAAATPVKDEGLIGELLHLLLTPDHGGASSMDPEYLQAAEIGKRNEDCSMAYSSCPIGRGLLDQISIIS